jgi:hypothetical protein
MKKIKIALLFVALATLFLHFSCGNIIEYSDVPEVSYKDFSLAQTTDILGNQIIKATLTIHVIDGNGDIGLNDYDTTGSFSPDSIYYNDLFLKLFQKIDGKFVEKQLIVPHRYRMPDVQPKGQVQSLVADIQVAIDYTKGTFDSDTIKYEFYIYDRALNISNVAESPELPISYYLAKH